MYKQNPRGYISHYTVKVLSIVIDIGVCLVSYIWMKENGMDPTLDSQIVRASKKRSVPTP